MTLSTTQHADATRAFEIARVCVRAFRLPDSIDLESDCGLWACELVLHDAYPADRPASERDAWVYACVKNRVRSWLRSRKQRREHLLCDMGGPPRRTPVRLEQIGEPDPIEAMLFRNEVTPLDTLISRADQARAAKELAGLKPSGFSRKDWLVQRERRRRLRREHAERARVDG